MKSELLDALHAGQVTIRFTKLDGEERVMVCTLNEDLIPEEDKPNGNGTPRPEGLISAYDIDKGGWRSFYEYNVISASLVLHTSNEQPTLPLEVTGISVGH